MEEEITQNEQEPIVPQGEVQHFGRPVMVRGSQIAQKGRNVGAFTAFVKGTPEKRDSGLPYDPTYEPTLGESLASIPTDFIRSGVGVAMEAWSPEVRAARDSIDAVRRIDPDTADKIEEATLGKKLTTTQTAIKGAAAVGEGLLSIAPFFKFGRMAIGGAELALLGKTGKAIKLGEEAVKAKKIGIGLGGEAVIKGTPLESMILKSEEEATEAILKLGVSGKKFAQSKTLQRLYSNGLNGALYGGLYGLHANEGKLIEGLKGAAIGGTFGVGLGAAVTGVLKVGKLGLGVAKSAIPVFGAIDKKLIEVLPIEWYSSAFSVGSAMKKYYGDVGETFFTMWNQASKLANADLGKLQLALIDNGLMEAPVGLGKAFKNREFIGNDTQRMMHYNEVLQGLGAYSNKEYQKAAIAADPHLKFLDGMRKRYFVSAQRGELLDAGRDLDTYLPKHTPVIGLKEKSRIALNKATTQAEREKIFEANDPMVKEMVENSVLHEKAFKTLDESYQAYYDYAEIVNSGSHKPSGDNATIRWLVYSGKAKNEKEAIGMIIADLKFRKQTLTPQAGSLDFKRKVNLPWYDPNPARVMPQYAFDASMRIEMAKKFLADDGVLKEMLAKVKEESGEDASKTFEKFIRRVTGQVERNTVAEKASNFVRAIEILKMTYAPIMNLGQSLNTLLASDFGVTIHGLRHAFTDENIRNAIERGTLTNTLIRQIFEYNSGGAKWAEKYLKFIGFTYSEMFNRAVASTAADKWMQNNLLGLLKKYGLKNLSEEELLAANKMLLSKESMEEEALLGGIKVQEELFDEFHKKFPDEDFKATVGNISAAKSSIEKFNSKASKEIEKRQSEIEILEKELLAEAEPITRDGTQDLRQQIIEMREKLSKMETPEVAKEGEVVSETPKVYSTEEVSGAVTAATQLKREKLGRIITSLERKLAEQDSTGIAAGEKVATQVRPQSMKEIRVETQKNLTKLEEQTKKIERAKDILKQQRYSEAVPFTDSEIVDLKEVVNLLKSSADSYTGGNYYLPVDIVQESLTEGQQKSLTDILKGVTIERRARLERAIIKLEDKFNEARAVGRIEPGAKVGKKPLTQEQIDIQKKKSILDIDEQIKSLDEKIKENNNAIKVLSEEETNVTDQIIADIHSHIKDLNSEIVGIQNDLADKEILLNGIIDSYRIAGKRALEKHPEGLAYDKWLAGRKIMIGGEKEVKESGLSRQLLTLTKEKGGATLDIYGNVPQQRYIYAQNKGTEFSVPFEDASEAEIEKYILEHLDEFKTGKYVGTWKEEGRLYHDVSTASDDYKNSLLEASKAEQIGIYDQRTGETKYIKDAIEEGVIDAPITGGGISEGVSPQDLVGRTEAQTPRESILDKIKRENLPEYKALDELGLPVDDIVARGFLTQQEKALGAQAFVEKTQFLGRPIDLPYFASSPVGKVFFQFKTFAYQQARFVVKQLKDDLKSGDSIYVRGVKMPRYSKAMRDILILGTVFPVTGEILSDIRSLITQEKRPTKFFDRYFSDIFSAGTYGLLADLYRSAEGGDIERLLLGAAPGDLVNYAEQLVQIPGNMASGDADRSIRNITKNLLNQTGVGKPVANIAFPKKGKNLKSSFESLQDLLDWDGD